MKKIYYLGSCDTCQRIIKELEIGDDVILQDIKKEAITADQLEVMKNLAGSYEKLFSKVAKKYKAMGLNEITMKEADFKKYMLIEYTFLKRPVIIVDNKIFIGNSPQAVESAKQALHV